MPSQALPVDPLSAGPGRRSHHGTKRRALPLTTGSEHGASFGEIDARRRARLVFADRHATACIGEVDPEIALALRAQLVAHWLIGRGEGDRESSAEFLGAPAAELRERRRTQLERVFVRELEAFGARRPAVLNALDAVTSPEASGFLRSSLAHSPRAAETMLGSCLVELLSD